MRKFSVALILLMAFAVTAQAGTAAFGIKAGVNFASITGDDTDDLKSKTGFAVGGFADIPLSPAFSIQPELFYSQKGAKFDDDTFDVSVKLDYIDIPVLGKYTFAGESARPYLMAGPSLGFKMSSKLSAEGMSEDLDNVASTDFGLVFGGGVNFQKFLIEVRYNLGMSNIIDDSDDPDSIKNAVWGVLLGYTF